MRSGTHWRRAGRDDRALAAGATFGVLSGGIIAFAATRLVEASVPLGAFAPACPLHALTGVPCPGCGSTRAALALLSGDPVGALAMNPLFTLAFAGGALSGVVAPLWVLARGPLPVALGARGPGRVRAALVAVIALNWAYLILRGA